MKNEIILQASQISIGYISKKEKKIIASNIDLSFQKGKLIALIGVNGIGKSTLLKTITGIQKTISGTVFLNGLNLNTLDPVLVAQNLSVVLTEKLPPSNLTVFELVALGRYPYTNWIGTLTPKDIAKVNQAMELTKISALATKKHYEISDGQLQKVILARALAQDTPLIVLDEPTTHLDLPNKVSLFKLLKKLSRENDKCIVFSTHDIDMAIQLSDEIIMMTPDSVIQEVPFNLISKGNFAALFKDESIIFDPEKGKFTIL